MYVNTNSVVDDENRVNIATIRRGTYGGDGWYGKRRSIEQLDRLSKAVYHNPMALPGPSVGVQIPPVVYQRRNYTSTDTTAAPNTSEAHLERVVEEGVYVNLWFCCRSSLEALMKLFLLKNNRWLADYQQWCGQLEDAQSWLGWK